MGSQNVKSTPTNQASTTQCIGLELFQLINEEPDQADVEKAVQGRKQSSNSTESGPLQEKIPDKEQKYGNQLTMNTTSSCFVPQSSSASSKNLENDQKLSDSESQSATPDDDEGCLDKKKVSSQQASKKKPLQQSQQSTTQKKDQTKENEA